MSDVLAIHRDGTASPIQGDFAKKIGSAVVSGAPKTKPAGRLVSTTGIL